MAGFTPVNAFQKGPPPTPSTTGSAKNPLESQRFNVGINGKGSSSSSSPSLKPPESGSHLPSIGTFTSANDISAANSKGGTSSPKPPFSNAKDDVLAVSPQQTSGQMTLSSTPTVIKLPGSSPESNDTLFDPSSTAPAGSGSLTDSTIKVETGSGADRSALESSFQATPITTASSAISGPHASSSGSHHYNPFIYPQQRSRANPSLDFSSVERRSLSKDNLTRSTRPFDLVNAPTFHPTEAEFKDPLAYISSIAKIGKQYGIAKIIPPIDWDPPFCLDTEMFWFKTRRQSLNSIDGGQKAKSNFVASLYYFHRKGGNPISKLPSIDKRPLDLFHLHQCVQLRGGFTEVCKKKLWAQIGRELGYSGKIMTSLSTSLKTAYQKLLYPYDIYLEKHGAGTLNSGIRIPDYEVPNDIEQGDLKETSESTSSIPIKREFEDVVSNDLLPSNETLDPTSVSSSPVNKKIKLDNGIQISVQNSPNSGSSSASSSSHTSSPPSFRVLCSESSIHRIKPYSGKPSIPDDPTIPPFDTWHGGMDLIDDYSLDFKEAPSYNLRQFQQKADTFLEKYFEGLNVAPSEINEEMVESEYWRLIRNMNESIEVEYGADIHTSIHCSPFPQVERDFFTPYTQHPWNLNVLPFLEKSLCRYVDASVPFLVQPWLLVGMLFATQSWHFEDFYSYSVSYQHFGDTKTWYSVPEEDSAKFRQLLEKELSKTGSSSRLLQPDLMICPQTLVENDIKCYALDQRAGQIVITFPKSYHCHFNHGFNLNESVNVFPFEDWLNYGYQCLDEVYSRFKIEAPFSIQKLLLSMTSKDVGISTAKM